MPKTERVLALALTLLTLAIAPEAGACGPKTFPKLECGATARLCTNRRNGLAWEWVTLKGQEAKDYCNAPAARDAGGGHDEDEAPVKELEESSNL